MTEQKIYNEDWQIGIKRIENNTIDLVVTDPPYGMDYQSNRRKELHKSIKNDTNLDWLGGWVKELKRVCKDEAHVYIFCSWHHIDKFKQEVGALFNVKNILIWEKNNHGSGDLLGDYAPKYEMILFCSNGQKKLKLGRDSNILKAKKTGNDNHPTQKPTELISYLIEKSSNKGDLVLDTFAGSCVTAIASRQKDRNCICFEIDKDYCKNGEKVLFGTSQSLF
jgi:site-specific DNA-methyltransferase (adenine-specific)